MAFLIAWKDKILKDDIWTLSAALAFYTTLSLAPLLLLTLGLLASTGLGMQAQLLDQIQSLLGNSVTDAVRTIMNQAGANRGVIALANWSGIATLLLSASFVFVQLQSSLNLIFEAVGADAPGESGWSWVKKFLARRALCVGLVLTFVFLSIVSLVVSTAVSVLLKPSNYLVLHALHLLGTFAIFTLLFGAIFRWMPDRRVSPSASLRGGAATALFFGVGKVLLGLYLARAGLGSPYGAAGSLIVLLVWVYYSSLILFSGAELAFLLSHQSPAVGTGRLKLSA